MAIGLAKMFGFHFKENFNHPYIAKSIQDFWRRWHISLSTWFRDYLYISLGGNQKGLYRTYLNLVIVFFVTGLWHGASWNFIIWGLFHGLFLVLERSNIINLDKFPGPLKHFYVTMVVVIGWVFFRAENLRDAGRYLRVMAGIISGDNYGALISANYYTAVVFLLGILFCMPIRITWSTYVEKLARAQNFLLIGKCVFYFSLLLWCISELATSTYNPFIYFRF
jgi:alginate O-acetyltransferase complex protein AlgI